MRRKSRLSQRSLRKTKKNLILTILGMIVILFILLKFGLEFLANATIFISGLNDSDQDTQKKPGFLATPVLNPLPNATNSARLIISGQSFEKMVINLYVNGEFVEDTVVDEDGEFEFKYDLDNGDNSIKVNAEEDEKKSEYSKEISVILDKKSPDLEITSPSDGQSFSKDQNSTNVTGKSESGVNITINSFWAVSDDEGNFSYSLHLKDGENKIEVIAQDEAGNRTTKELKVNYSP